MGLDYLIEIILCRATHDCAASSRDPLGHATAFESECRHLRTTDVQPGTRLSSGTPITTRDGSKRAPGRLASPGSGRSTCSFRTLRSDCYCSNLAETEIATPCRDHRPCALIINGGSTGYVMRRSVPSLGLLMDVPLAVGLRAVALWVDRSSWISTAERSSDSGRSTSLVTTTVCDSHRDGKHGRRKDWRVLRAWRRLRCERSTLAGLRH